MMYLSKILLVLLLMQTSFAGLSGKRQRIVDVIDMELNELGRLSRVSGNNDPETLLRIAELNLEKGRLFREDENEKFFELPIKKRRNINRKKYFSRSQESFNKAQKTGMFILGKFKRFRNIGEVYYILAFNEKENVNLGKAKKMFLRSIKMSKKSSPTSKRSRLAIADIYYSEGNFKKSKLNYDYVINTIKNDKWYTKYLYNLAWSNFRLGNKELATRQMNTVHKLSKTSQYVDKSKYASRDLGFFYADKGDVEGAKRFYKKNNVNIAKNFYEMGLFLKDKQKYSKALNMFKSAYSTNDKEYGKKSLTEILNLLDKYNNNKQFLVYVNIVKKLNLNKEEKKEVMFYISKRAALLQKEITMAHNKNRPSVLKFKGNTAAELYLILVQLDPSLSERSVFFAAESYYQAREYSRAIAEYDKIISMGNIKSKYYQRSLNGMMLALNIKGLKETTRENYFEKIYLLYIKNTSDLKKKSKAIEKLFSYFVDERKDLSKAENIFFQFSAFNKNKISKNEAMIGRIVDLYKREKAKKKLLAFVAQLKTTNIQLRPSFVKRLNRIILTTQFASVQKANSKGDKLYALRGYLTIYKDKESSSEARRNAAYNIAVLFYELGNEKLTNKWATRAIQDMTVNEVIKFSNSFYLIINDLYLRQLFSEGKVLSESLLTKLCTIGNKNKDLVYSNYVVMGLSERSTASLFSFRKAQSGCKFSTGTREKEAELYYEYYLEEGNLVKAYEEYNLLAKIYNNDTDRLNSLSLLLTQKMLGQSLEGWEKSLVKKLYKKANKNKLNSKSINIYGSFEVDKLLSYADKASHIKLRFPQNKYNALLKMKFAAIDNLTKRSIKVLKVGSGDAMVDTYSILIQAYDDFAKEVSAFSPTGKSADYVASFRKGMTPIVTALTTKVSQFKKELGSEVAKNTILSMKYAKLINHEIPLVLEHPAVLMDRRGL